MNKAVQMCYYLAQLGDALLGRMRRFENMLAAYGKFFDDEERRTITRLSEEIPVGQYDVEEDFANSFIARESFPSGQIVAEEADGVDNEANNDEYNDGQPDDASSLASNFLDDEGYFASQPIPSAAYPFAYGVDDEGVDGQIEDDTTFWSYSNELQGGPKSTLQGSPKDLSTTASAPASRFQETPHDFFSPQDNSGTLSRPPPELDSTTNIHFSFESNTDKPKIIESGPQTKISATKRQNDTFSNDNGSDAHSNVAMIEQLQTLNLGGGSET
ncbi:hypothetical protein MMC28_008591 [Mycoblastus sanguinarius]|nr:hypothetical protein [Mycoblastus sanguinarius]